MRRKAPFTEICAGAPRRACLFVALAFAATPAAAESPYCSDLRAQIARAGGAGSPRYRAAAAKQQGEIARAVAYSRGIGCERQQFLFFGEAPPPQCGQITARIAQMRANLESLQARGGGDDGRKQALQARYDAQCRPRPAEPSFLEQLFGSVAAPEPPPVAPSPPPEPTRLERLPGRETPEEAGEDERAQGGSEAVCVRSCDGGFFPITYSARRSNLDDLNALCKALCPGAEAELYTKGPWREIDTAVSIGGDAYSDLPNALKFQKTRDPSCSCKPKGQDWAEALGEAERILETSYTKDQVVTPEEAEKLSRPLPVAGASPRAGKNKSTRRDAPVAEATTQAAETSAPPSIGAAQGEVRETVGPDGATRRVRVVAPAL